MNHTIKLMARTATTLILASAFALTARAQQRGAVTPSTLERERQARDAEIREQLDQERELMMTMTEQLRNSAPSSRRAPRMDFEQINEDFVRLQKVNNSLAQAVVTSDSIDLKLVAQFAAEIKKRADRLKLNLSLPEPEPGAARNKIVVGPEAKHLRPALAALDIIVLRVARNPLFKNPKLVDARQAPQVRLDLETIIELCAELRKRSEQLSKARQKTP
ncbi:MAG TPA: hypothetical protein VF735_06540 [Pyrinomonadaceae bacterium]|jgi:hypothetical protein